MEQYQEFEVIATCDNGMEACIWLEEDGWHGEVADPGDHCQGAAWGTTKEAAIAATMAEVEYINHCVKMGY